MSAIAGLFRIASSSQGTGADVKVDLGGLNTLLGCVTADGKCTPDVGITEIIGDPGAGKTQLIMHLTSSLLRLNPKSCVVIIDSERCVSRQRIQEMCDGEPLTHDRLMVLPVEDANEMTLCVNSLDELISHRPEIRAVMIDSIAFPGKLAIHEGQPDLPTQWARQLAHVCKKYGIPAFVTNHTATAFVNQRPKLLPALGPRWARFNARRVWLEKKKYDDQSIVMTTVKCNGFRSGPKHVLITTHGLQESKEE